MYSAHPSVSLKPRLSPALIVESCRRGPQDDTLSCVILRERSERRIPMMRLLNSGHHRDSHPSGTMPSRLTALRMTSILGHVILCPALLVKSCRRGPFEEARRRTPSLLSFRGALRLRSGPSVLRRGIPMMRLLKSLNHRDSHPSGTMSSRLTLVLSHILSLPKDCRRGAQNDI